jgi:arylsulfatase A-like enzyme
MRSLRFCGFALLASLVLFLGCHRPTGDRCLDCNVILISMDTLRADHLGAYGYSRPVSPNIDELASRSRVFRDAVSQSAWTRPAHASMFTGLSPSEHGLISMEGQPALPTETVTLASLLSSSGYETWGLVGGGNVDARFGFDIGFDVYESAGRRFEDNLARAEELLTARRQREERKPFFLFFHGFDAHKPYKSFPEDRQALGLGPERAKGMDALCRGAVSPAQLAPFLDDYDAAIHRGDRSLGRLLKLIDEVGETDRTVILLTSDHGEEFGEHGGCFHIRTLFREVVTVPWILHVPGSNAAGEVAGPIPASTAVFATLLDSVGLKAGTEHAHSLTAAKPEAPLSFDSVVSATSSRIRGSSGGELHSLTTDVEKLVHWLDHDRRERFDWQQDPDELNPTTIDKSAPLARELRDWLAAHPQRLEPRRLGALPEDLSRNLRRLGYVD